jgi:hypothetical protein
MRVEIVVGSALDTCGVSVLRRESSSVFSVMSFSKQWCYVTQGDAPKPKGLTSAVACDGVLVIYPSNACSGLCGLNEDYRSSSDKRYFFSPYVSELARFLRVVSFLG